MINIFQIKKQDKTSEKDFNEMEKNNAPDKEFKLKFLRCSLNSGEDQMNTVRISKNTENVRQ